MSIVISPSTDKGTPITQCEGKPSCRPFLFSVEKEWQWDCFIKQKDEARKQPEFMSKAFKSMGLACASLYNTHSTLPAAPSFTGMQ
jgi:hypothetical protein